MQTPVATLYLSVLSRVSSHFVLHYNLLLEARFVCLLFWGFCFLFFKLQREKKKIKEKNKAEHFIAFLLTRDCQPSAAQSPAPSPTAQQPQVKAAPGPRAGP